MDKIRKGKATGAGEICAVLSLLPRESAWLCFGVTLSGGHRARREICPVALAQKCVREVSSLRLRELWRV